MLIFFSTGCATIKKEPPVEKKTAMNRMTAAAYPQFSDDMGYDGLEAAIHQSISYLNRIPSDKAFRFGNDVFDTGHMIRSLEYFRNYIRTKPSTPDLEKFIRTNYRVYRSTGRDSDAQVLFTGYYEPILQGSLEKTDEYRFPLYTRPDNLLTVDLSLFSSRFKGEKIIGRIANQTFVPYYNRKEIDGALLLNGQVRELAWVSDPVDLFFLHVQGSGRIYLNNGISINVHYHTTNGRPYRSIGKLLIDEGKIDRSEMSMQKIRSYLQEHPGEIKTVLNYNPSYVFFKIENEGPLGYLEVKLVPGRSLALDRRVFPLSGLAFIETHKPLVDGDGKIHTWSDCKRFVLNQDTGGVIRGPGRADLFWGNGAYAEIAAGHMQHTGSLYFLILKPDA
ncbi:MAG: murein transglycosylase A [Deltaproteobacteria bacterium]|nr:murein transglycosylase A [Deltaproteobacteria bacterium]MBW2192649.1 murein transglycosylase A [Deltaproteobacteria bacterium]